MSCCIYRLFITLVTLAILGLSSGTRRLLDADDDDDGDISYRLPTTLYPEIYRLELLTNLADLNDNFTFSGKVWIQIKCVEATDKIILHSKNLEIKEHGVSVMPHNSPVEAEYDKAFGPKKRICKSPCGIKILKHCYHDDYELYIITLAESLKPGQTYDLFIPYMGELTQVLAGFYRSSYKDASGETRWIAVTQFESTDARRALPCFDEPSFKARFQVNIGHINSRTSLSNMRKVNTVPVDNMKNWVWDQYEISVPMSTYLLAFVVSDFQYKAAPKLPNGVLFRVWARDTAINQVDYATVVGPQVLEYFELYFDVKYPLPKMDMIAIPDFSSGAMENWGLITYREVALLYDPKVSVASSQPYVASVIAHELAHQWFGNLVTMKWWTDLWLNEGFATYVAALGVHYLHPQWNYLEEEVVDNMMSVFSLDSLKSSHPISVPIGDPKEIAQIFDTISYKKGSFVLRMMNLFLGEDTFRAGVTKYLKKHAYSNAEQDDLWDSLTREAHRNKVLPTYLKIKQIMDTWTLQTGFPVVTVTRDYRTGKITVLQERYLADRTDSDADNQPSSTLWWIPLSYTYESEANFNETRPKEWLSNRYTEIEIENLPRKDWILFNIQISVPYHVKYDQENWKRIYKALRKYHRRIGLLNRVQIIEDSQVLARTGDCPYHTAFNILKYLEKETEYLPWKTALRNLAFLDKMLRFYPIYGEFRYFIKNLIEPMYEALKDKEYKAVPENLSRIKHQTMILAWACKFEVGDCRDIAIKNFKHWMESDNPSVIPIPKDFRGHTYCTAIRFGGEKEWNFLWQRYLESNVGNERSLILSSLSCSREVWILNRYLDWTLNENSGIRKQDSTAVFAAVARGDIGFFLANAFLRNRLGDIYEFFGPKSTRIGTFVNVVAAQLTTDVDLNEFIQFTKENEIYLRHSLQAVNQGLESAKINCQWQRNHYSTVATLLINYSKDNQQENQDYNY